MSDRDDTDQLNHMNTINITNEEDLIERIAELDETSSPQTFRSLIATINASDPDTQYHDYVSLVREKFNDWCVLDKQDREQWLSEIQNIEDEGQRSTELKEYYEKLLPDNKNCEFYAEYLTFAVTSYTNDIKDSTGQGHSLFNPSEIETLITQALSDTKYHFTQSQRIWSIVLDLELRNNADQLTKITELYLVRLSIPHLQLDQTFSDYSSFISQYSQSNYENRMKQANKIYQATKKRQEALDLEIKYQHLDLTNAEEWIELMEHTHLLTPKKQRTIDQLTPIFESAITYARDRQSLWEKYINYHYEYLVRDKLIKELLSRYVRSFSESLKPYTETLHNLATTEDPLSVYDSLQQRLVILLPNYKNHEMGYEQWRDFVIAMLSFQLHSVLKGEARFQEAIIETASGYFQQSLQCGDEQDTFHSVPRFVLNLFEKLNELDKVRSGYRLLTSKYETETEGWLTSYQFERRAGQDASALKVLIAAINRAEKLDWPERIIEEVLRFAELTADALILRDLKVKLERKYKEVEKDRIRRMEQSEAEAEWDILDVHQGPKRLLEEVEDEHSNKRAKPSNETPPLNAIQPAAVTSKNRETLTVSVQNIPTQITEKQLLNFFKDCGDIVELKISTLPNKTQQANIVFDSDKSLKRALTKDYKSLSGNQLRIQRITKNTIWVTNYPPHYTETQLTQLFERCGVISSIRFPSLKFNTQRRFCYIEYTNPESASQAVAQLNDQLIEGFKLMVKISDPTSKQSRKGATEEKREVYVHQLDFFKVDANKLKTLFEKYGVIEGINIPLSEQSQSQSQSQNQGKPHGKRKNDGFAFVIFERPEEAEAAVEALNLVTFEGRVIQVSISETKAQRSHKKELAVVKKTSSKDSDKIIVLRNVSDIVNAARLKTLIHDQLNEDVVNVTLEPQLSAAIVEFKDSHGAGVASLKLQGLELEGKLLQIGDLKSLKAELTNNDNNNNQGKGKDNTSGVLVPNRLQRRKMMREVNTVKIASSDKETAGEKSASIATASENQCDITEVKEAEKPKPKSNADFRAMFLSGSK